MFSQENVMVPFSSINSRIHLPFPSPTVSTCFHLSPCFSLLGWESPPHHRAGFRHSFARASSSILAQETGLGLERLRNRRLFPPPGSGTAPTVKPNLGTWHAIQLTVPLRTPWIKFRGIKIMFWILFSSSRHTRAVLEPALLKMGKQKKKKMCKIGIKQNCYDCIKPHSFLPNPCPRNLSEGVSPLLLMWSDETSFFPIESDTFSCFIVLKVY